MKKALVRKTAIVTIVVVLFLSFVFACMIDLGDVTIPGDVTGLTAVQESDRSVTLSWTNPLDEDFAGVTITWAPNGETPVEVDAATTFRTAVLSAGPNYAFLVKSRDEIGNLSAGVSVNCEVPRVWSAAGAVESESVSINQPQMAVDGLGTVFAVWQQTDGANNRIKASRNDGSGWTAMTGYLSGASVDPGNVQVAADATGNAIAIWVQAEGSYQYIYASRFSHGADWEATPTRLSVLSAETTHLSYYPEIAMTQDGTAFVVWVKDGDSDPEVWAARFDGSSWGAAVSISAGLCVVERPGVAVDGGGNAIAVWTQNSTRNHIHANRYVIAAGGWQTPVLIESDVDNSASQPRVAADATGNAAVVWLDATKPFGVLSTRYAMDEVWDGTDWSSQSSISLQVGTFSSLDLAVAGAGTYRAIWEISAMDFHSVYTNRCDAGGWGTPLENANIPMSEELMPSLAVDGSGMATMTWVKQDEPLNDIVAANNTETGWGSAVSLFQPGAAALIADQGVRTNRDGAAVAYALYDGNLYARLYR